MGVRSVHKKGFLEMLGNQKGAKPFKRFSKKKGN